MFANIRHFVNAEPAWTFLILTFVYMVVLSAIAIVLMVTVGAMWGVVAIAVGVIAYLAYGMYSVFTH